VENEVASAQPVSTLSSRYPLALLYVCLCGIAGLFFASLGMPSSLPVAIGVVLGVGLLLAPSGQWQLTLLLLACGTVGSAGAWRYQTTAYHDGPSQVAHYIGRSVGVVGVVDGEPQSAGHGENLALRVESLTVSGRVVHAGGRIIVHYTGSQQVEYGDRLTLTGKLSQPVNPPGFDYRGYLARQGVHAVLDFPRLQIQSRGAGNPFQALALGIRDALRQRMPASTCRCCITFLTVLSMAPEPSGNRRARKAG
jgi:competence protein ComEC